VAYVPDYDQDVFVSYTHLDSEGDSPWVATLVQDLNILIRQRLGIKSLHIWHDNSFEGNRPITPDTLQAIRRAATLLIVMSPGYLNSEWCTKERNTFLSVARDCVEAGRVFIVNYLDTNRSEIPAEFRELKGYKFWTRDGGVTRPLQGHSIQDSRC
jgi:TIR domain